MVFWSPASCFGDAAGLNVRDVNVHGVAVGRQLRFVSWTAFMWTVEGGVQSFPFPPGSSDTHAVGITDDGLVAGHGGIDGALRGWVHDGTTMTFIDPLPGAFQSVEVVGLADDGTVVGEIHTTNPNVPVAPFRWKDGTITAIEDPQFRIPVHLVGATADGTAYGAFWNQDASPARWEPVIVAGDDVRPLPIPSETTFGRVADAAGPETWLAVVEMPADGNERPMPALLTDSAYVLPHTGPFTEMFLDVSIDERLFSGRARSGDAGPWKEVVWDDGTIRPSMAVVDDTAAGELSSLQVRHSSNGTLYLLGAGHPDVNIVSMVAPVAPPVAGDLDCDGLVGFPDLLILPSAWTRDDAPRADLDGSGTIGLGDLQTLLQLRG